MRRCNDGDIATCPCRGQNISSEQSHKSYRPVTVLSFRLLARAAKRITAVPESAAARSDPSEAQARQASFGTAPFHLANIALHCLVTIFIYRLSAAAEMECCYTWNWRTVRRVFAFVDVTLLMLSMQLGAAALSTPAGRQATAPQPVDGGAATDSAAGTRARAGAARLQVAAAWRRGV